MALMFSRLARNFVKNGYFPTDDDTLERIQQMLVPPTPGAGIARLLDPCCGEGAALADITAALRSNDAPDNQVSLESLGVEFDAERAWHAKSVLDRVIHADVHDVVIKPRSISLLFLNPPYGYGVKDAANSAGPDGGERAERLERTFLKKTAPLLALGGVLVYIVPFYALDDEIRLYLARNFTRLRFFMAPEQKFQQCVIVGVKTRPGHPPKDVLQMLSRAQAGEFKDQVLPPYWEEAPYELVAGQSDAAFDFHAVRIDGPQLKDELEKHRHSLLWQGFDGFFNQAKGEHRRPLRDMTKWHLALALAAGQVTGKIRSAGGRVFLIKGDTFKRKERTVSTEVDGDGNVSQTVVMLDRFVPVINAIELTPGERLGEIVKIS